jgi:hypothetical protein
MPFGVYAESHEDAVKTKTTVARTQGKICLGPSSNFQGNYKLLALNSGRKITRKQFTELPMSDSVIKQVKALAEKEKQGDEIIFTDPNNNPIENDDGATMKTVAPPQECMKKEMKTKKMKMKKKKAITKTTTSHP